jgi:hypothetical protein
MSADVSMQFDGVEMMKIIFKSMGTPFVKVEVTPLTAMFLEKYRVPLLDAVLCFVLPRLSSHEISEVCQAHLASLKAPELLVP